ncbi:MAG: luciferase family protein, partial [Longimicrobiales bacterium]
CVPDPDGSAALQPLPLRAPPAAVTTGSVPHRQIDPEISQVAIAELHGRVLGIPEVELRQSATVGDATAIWIREEIDLERPGCISTGRQVAHIHHDGSLHAVLPHARIADAESAGWIELHPYAGDRPGFETYVLVFSPRTSEEVDVVHNLILEGLDFLTGG